MVNMGGTLMTVLLSVAVTMITNRAMNRQLRRDLRRTLLCAERLAKVINYVDLCSSLDRGHVLLLKREANWVKKHSRLGELFQRYRSLMEHEGDNG